MSAKTKKFFAKLNREIFRARPYVVVIAGTPVFAGLHLTWEAAHAVAVEKGGRVAKWDDEGRCHRYRDGTVTP